MNRKYLNQFIRNIGILTEEEQEKIRNAKIAILGCGGGSEMARQLVQTGFEHIYLADFDTVDLHNLNRQFFFQEDIGINKALALAKNLKRINPDLDLEVATKKVSIDSVKDIVKRYDLIIDAIPPECGLKEELALAREVRKYDHKYQLYFMDIPWSGKLIIFSKSSKQMFEDFIGVPKNCTFSYIDKMSLEEMTINYMKKASIDMDRVGKMMYARKSDYYPQMAVGISLVSSMVATACIFISIGKNIKLAPAIFTVDFLIDFVSPQ